MYKYTPTHLLNLTSLYGGGTIIFFKHAYNCIEGNRHRTSDIKTNIFLIAPNCSCHVLYVYHYKKKK